MAKIITEENYSATVIPQDATISTGLSERGPRGFKGDKGDPAFMTFKLDSNGNLIYESVSEDYEFSINKDGELIVEF